MLQWLLHNLACMNDLNDYQNSPGKWDQYRERHTHSQKRQVFPEQYYRTLVGSEEDSILSASALECLVFQTMPMAGKLHPNTGK